MLHRDSISQMRLGDFILENMEVILMAWEDFAREFWKGPLPDSVTLRNHAQIMLKAVVEDMATAQSEDERKSKSHGKQVGTNSTMNRAALGHALARVNDGFDIGRMVAEFRALRASVNRLWWKSVPAPHEEQIEDMNRFNEAVDQLVSASLTGFTGRVEQSRRLFLGILGHDLRQPLHSMRMFTEILTESAVLQPEAASILSSMGKCCDSMANLLGDLLDFTTSQLGCAMPVYPATCNLEMICREVLGEVRATAPDRAFRLDTSGELYGEWDASRMRQVFSNLLSNARHHGSKDHPIHAQLRGSPDEVALTVHNMGPHIPPESMRILFDPMVRFAIPNDRPPGSIGLGLYICHQIAVAHGGRIEVESSAENGTTFTVTLPKRSAANP
ncbi:MAG: HAMP domain-containing sensor histidine kinase [Verrucomicrobiota bacterium]